MSEKLVLPHPCFISPVLYGRESCKEKLGLSSKLVALLFGFVGEHKGFDMVIRALKNPGMPRDLVVLVAGEARIERDKAYLRGLLGLVRYEHLDDRVIFKGYVQDEDIPLVMGASDLAIFPYHRVVQSGAIFHPLAYGVPVLASDIGGFREMARYDCLKLFRRGDQRDLEEKMILLLSSPALRRELSIKARKYCEQSSVQILSKRLLKIYEEG